MAQIPGLFFLPVADRFDAAPSPDRYMNFSVCACFREVVLCKQSIGLNFLLLLPSADDLPSPGRRVLVKRFSDPVPPLALSAFATGFQPGIFFAVFCFSSVYPIFS